MQDERIMAIREDISEWFNTLFTLSLSEQNVMAQLATGILVCELAQLIEAAGAAHAADNAKAPASPAMPAMPASPASPAVVETAETVALKAGSRQLWKKVTAPSGTVSIKINKLARPGSFQARDNVSVRPATQLCFFFHFFPLFVFFD